MSGTATQAHAIRVVRLALAAALAALAIMAAPSARAQPLGVATWNLAWLMDQATHARWVAACARLGWPTDTAALAPQDRRALEGLPYCNVHNGMRFPPQDCSAQDEDWPQRARYRPGHPCRDTADLADPVAYQDKLEQLRRWFARLAGQGVSVVVLQEIFDESAVRPLLPPGWSVRSSRGLPGSPDIAQQLGVAWAPGLAPTDVRVEAALAESGPGLRPLRPGLAFSLPVGGRPVDFLVVHLKAGCRSRVIDDPLRPDDPPHRRDAIASDCAMLRRQLPALEDWIDARAGRDFVVLGDFNRSLFLEPVRERPDRPTRLDGSSASSPSGPCALVSEDGRLQARCPARTSALFPELNDDDPPGSVLWRARPPELAGGRIRPGSAADCNLRGGQPPRRGAGDLAHDGIDHVLLSDSLKRRLSPQALVLRMLGPLDEAGRPFAAAPDRALPTDHCPHWVVLD
ncbi:MAG: endonuclease/exonuclease/phosphatase family protein [Burkholderiales bacterium]